MMYVRVHPSGAHDMTIGRMRNTRLGFKYLLGQQTKTFFAKIFVTKKKGLLHWYLKEQADSLALLLMLLLFLLLMLMLLLMMVLLLFCS